MTQTREKAYLRRPRARPAKTGRWLTLGAAWEKETRQRSDGVLGEAQHGAGRLGVGRHAHAPAAARTRRRSGEHVVILEPQRCGSFTLRA